MFAIEEDLDKKLWLYAIHLGKDRSEVINDLLRPIVASMVLYDSRDRRGTRNVELAAERGPETDGDPKVDLKGYEAFFNAIKRSDLVADDEHKDCAHFASSASGKSNCWPRVAPGSFSRVSSSDRHRGSNIFFQRPKLGFWDFTAAKIASRSAVW